MEAKPIRVLFVCLANICRSPMAEALLRHKLTQAGLQERVVVDSAGVNLWRSGAPPHERTVAVLKSRGIDCTHEARAFGKADMDRFDYILAMDDDILRSIWAVGRSNARVFPVLKYAPGIGCDRVNDPIRTGRFDECYTVLDRACDGFLAALRKQHEL